MTPELSLEVLGLSLETRNYTEDERQHLRTQREHTDKPVPRGAASGRPGRSPCRGSFPSPAGTLQDRAPWAKVLYRGKRQETQPPFHFVVRLCLCYDCIAFTECRHWHLCTVLFASYFTFRRKTLSNQGSRGVLHKWLTFNLSELCMESHQQRGLFQGLACFFVCF